VLPCPHKYNIVKVMEMKTSKERDMMLELEGNEC
jgi:hypothetical protein